MVEAEVIAEVNIHQQAFIPSTSGVTRRYFKIPRTPEGYNKSGIVVNVSVSYCLSNKTKFLVYSSRTDPIPNELQHEKFHGEFTDFVMLDLPYVTGDDYTNDYFSVETASDSCSVKAQVFYHGDDLPQIPEG